MKTRLKNIDYVLVSAILVLCVFGLVMVYSSSYTLATMRHDNGQYFFDRQLTFFILGLIVFVISIFISLKTLAKMSPILVGFSILLLLLVLTPQFGLERNFSQRWLNLAGFVFQPSEMIKIFMIIYFSAFYARRKPYFDDFWYGVFPPLAVLSVVVTAILLQPDLGTATHLLMICGLIILFSGVRGKHIFMLGSIATALFVIMAIAQPYRMERISSFFNTFEDIGDTGYQLVNSYVSIATGGFLGNGLGNSIQKLGYLPEAHTDFIMAVIIEELGVIGIIVVIGAYSVILYRGVMIAKQVEPLYYKLLALGITMQITTQALINLGAVTGLLPITGIPLPFISYGGTSLVIMLVASGILVNVSGRRPLQDV
ncbi:cell division-specific peptidoglycan biosynthesis regulator FtsW [Streptohalobacillus salinus]|uniref:Probable peptidoglycan glycosyltransferase FtsW n=1 Tax=Streptohalobacillus salinus TaxID=621096 RepID=A0A2V3WHZ0_9BACI|nr:putative lipid II flippase FtsW [Streptohalobacillus salinus]PXW93141.1 cell division-specific peptidoglycan biosynthesis regulator FtsW [Streptohalobacillus salinus]